jgi:hypothetical protein
MHNVINLNERRQQRMRARHNIGDHAATLRALYAEAIEEAACTARARAFEASERAILRDAYETVRTRHVAKVFAMPLKDGAYGCHERLARVPGADPRE